MKKKEVKGGGGVLFTVVYMAILQWLGYISTSWWVITSPLWIFLALGLGIMAIGLSLIGISKFIKFISPLISKVYNKINNISSKIYKKIFTKKSNQVKK